jgi:hypothetical protein
MQNKTQTGMVVIISSWERKMALGGFEKVISANSITKLKLAASKKLLQTNFFDAAIGALV